MTSFSLRLPSHKFFSGPAGTFICPKSSSAFQSHYQSQPLSMLLARTVRAAIEPPPHSLSVAGLIRSVLLTGRVMIFVSVPWGKFRKLLRSKLSLPVTVVVLVRQPPNADFPHSSTCLERKDTTPRLPLRTSMTTLA